KGLTDKFGEFLGELFAGGETDFIPAKKFGNHLRIKFPGEPGNRVLLLGHMDTVWPAGEIMNRPFKNEGGRAFGPGVFDMKSGIVLMWMALGALKHKPVTVLLTSDEEIGSPSSREDVENEAGQCKAVLVLEPSLPGGALKTARKGNG